jgi:ABC-type sugar transport system substrate-binding protein
VDGVIMLGGNEDAAFTDLAQRYPNAKLVFTGGSELANGAFLKPDAGRNGSLDGH